MKNRRVVVIGDSHTHTVKQAIAARMARNESVGVEAYAYSKVRKGREVGDLSLDAVNELVPSLAPADLLVSTIGGNHDAVLGLIQHPVPFDVMMPGSEPFDELPGIVMIPYAQMKAQLELAVSMRDRKKLRHLRKLARCAMIHLAPPPPKEDSVMLQRMRSPGYFFRVGGIAERGVSPPSLRLKLWQIQMSVLSDVAAELGIQLLPPPLPTITPDGFLKPEYFGKDASHANSAYGEALLDQIEGYRPEPTRSTGGVP